MYFYAASVSDCNGNTLGEARAQRLQWKARPHGERPKNIGNGFCGYLICPDGQTEMFFLYRV